MPSVVASSDVFTSHSTWLKPFALVFHCHPIHGRAQRSLSVFSPSLSTSCSTLFFLPFLMTDGDSVTINKPCATPQTGPSSPWTITSPITGYEPNAMEFTGTTELSDAVFSDINFQDSLVHTAHSSDLSWMTTRSASYSKKYTRDYADYRRAEGVSVSPSSESVMVDRTGEPVERSDSDHFGFSVRNVKSAQNQFPVITQAERMVRSNG